jgi:hypothetical protein
MMSPNELIKELGSVFSKKIDSLKYVDGVTPRWRLPDVFRTVNPDLVLMPPPTNTSQTTLREIKLVKDAVEKCKKDPDFEKFVLEFDDTPWRPFERRLLKNGFSQDRIDRMKFHFDETWQECKNLVKTFKHHFNRPRPEQIAPFFGIEIDVLETTTHQTPAYPSGHVVIAYLMNKIVEEDGGSPCCQDLVGLMGAARIGQGVHYPSDNAAGAKLGEFMWKQLDGVLYGINDGVFRWVDE